MSQTYPAYQLTCADIDRLKVVAARIFDRKVSPQSRLEIIARSAGFNSFAGMKAALKEAPVHLTGDQFYEERHIKSAGVDPRHVPFISGVSLNEIIAAGLAWSERDDPEWAASKSPRERLKLVKRDGGSMRDYLQFIYETVGADYDNPGIYRSSLTWHDIRKMDAEYKRRLECQDNAVIMTTPANVTDLSIDPMTMEPRLKSPGEWRCARIYLSEDNDFYEIPVAEPIPWGDKDAIKRLIEFSRIYVFDEKDLAAVKTALAETGIENLPDYRFFVAKPDILHIDEEEDGTFFTIGHTGATNCDLPKSDICNDSYELSDFAFNWLCEIVTVVHAFGREKRILSAEPASQDFRLQRKERNRLVVAL